MLRRLLGLPDDLLGLLGGLVGEAESLLRDLLGGLQPLPGSPLGGLQTFLGEEEEVPVSSSPLLDERLEAFLLLARTPREDLRRAQVVLRLIPQDLDAAAQALLDELSVALLELHEPDAVGEPLLRHPRVLRHVKAIKTTTLLSVEDAMEVMRRAGEVTYQSPRQ